MIKLELLVFEYKIDEVREILREIGIKKISTFEVKEYGQQKTHTEGYRGAYYVVDFTTKINLSILLDSPERIDRILHILSVANIEADVFVYDVVKRYTVSKRNSDENSWENQ